jgi:hypothetical protein
MSYTFGSSDASDFEMPDPDVYIFQITNVHEPEMRPNRFFDQFCRDFYKKHEVEYDRENDPQQKKEESSVVIDCTVFKSASGDAEWAGTMVKYYSSSKEGNELGSNEYPTKLRRLAVAVLGRPMENGEQVTSAQLLNQYFQGTYVHKTKQDGGLRGQIESPIPYKAQGTGQGGRRRQQTAPPPPPSVPVDEFDESEFDDELTA